MEGRHLRTDLPIDHVSVIPAGVSVLSWWNRPVDFACLYFTQQAVKAALGEEHLPHAGWELTPALAVQSPGICRLVRALASDTREGQPYGKMRGEALFQHLVTLLVADSRLLKDLRYKAGIGPRRVRRALEYIHSHISQELSLNQIALAAETSPYHLTRIFREATGYPVWRYVSRLRLQLAAGMMKDRDLTLVNVANLAGFASYSTFAATLSAERGLSPARFRNTMMNQS